jgi:hypothetical protein
MERRLLRRSLENESLRKELLADPKAAVEKTADTIYLVLPCVPTETQESGEFSDRDLEAVAGGWDAQTGATPAVPTRRLAVARCEESRQRAQLPLDPLRPPRSSRHRARWPDPYQCPPP